MSHNPHPLRIRRTRVGGSKMLDSAIYVGRPSKWGNPFRISNNSSPGETVEAFRAYCEFNPDFIKEIQSELRGRVLACWCPLESACHGDVLAEIANRS